MDTLSETRLNGGGERRVLGSIEGRLNSSEAGTFALCEAGAGHQVPCQVPEHLATRFRASAGRRVLVWGAITSDDEGQPLAIAAEGLMELGEPEALPTVAEVVGIAPELTGGVPVEEYVRRIRSDR